MANLQLGQLCTRCGFPVDIDNLGSLTNDYCYCSACEEEHWASMREQYPFGQCDQCGAAGYEHIRRDGYREVRFNHVEGGCSRWRDYADEDAREAELSDLDYVDVQAEDRRERERDIRESLRRAERIGGFRVIDDHLPF